MNQSDDHARCQLGLNFNVLTLSLIYSMSGHFAGFDENEPTSDSGGKTRVVKLLKARYGYKK